MVGTILIMRIAPQVTPPASPDAVKDLSPPGSILLSGTNALQLTAKVTAGTLTLEPRFWDGSSWVPLRGDAVVGSSAVVADFATAPIASLTMRRAAEPRWWVVIQSGGGTLDYCDISEAVK